MTWERMNFRKNGKPNLKAFALSSKSRREKRAISSTINRRNQGTGAPKQGLTGTPKAGASERLLCDPIGRTAALDPQIWEDERLPSRKKGDPARIRLVLQDHALYCSQSLQMPKERQTRPPSESPSLGGRLSSVPLPFGSLPLSNCFQGRRWGQTPSKRPALFLPPPGEWASQAALCC